MARRMEIELTSDRGDGTWTWRAAGARQPKGTLEAELLPPSAGVGDVLRVEVEGFLDGLSIVAVVPPKEARPEPERIELLAPRSDGPLVTSRVSRTPRSGRGRGDDRRRDRSDRGDGRDRDRRRGPRERTEGGDRPRSDERRGRERAARPSTPPPPAKPKPKRLRPGRKHRSTLLESLPVEQQPIAEQLLQGGIPAVRQAIEKQNEELKAEGKPQVKAEPLLDIAEKLRHRAQAAVWRDRADAALSHVDDIDLRDLRSVVNAAGDAGRDEESRAVAEQLREALLNRVEKEQAAWIAEVAENLQEGRVVRALRLSSRPPKAGSPLPADLSNRLVAATSAALTSDTVPQRWATVLEALAYSPIRRRVLPESLPTKLSSELRDVIARFAVQLPEIAHIFDIEPGKTPASDRPRPPRRPRKPQQPKPKPDAKAEGKARGPKPQQPQPEATTAEREQPEPEAATAERERPDTGTEAQQPQPEAATAEREQPQPEATEGTEPEAATSEPETATAEAEQPDAGTQSEQPEAEAATAEPEQPEGGSEAEASDGDGDSGNGAGDDLDTVEEAVSANRD